MIFFTELPLDVIREILAHLDGTDLKKLCVMNKKLREACNDKVWNEAAGKLYHYDEREVKRLSTYFLLRGGKLYHFLAALQEFGKKLHHSGLAYKYANNPIAANDSSIEFLFNDVAISSLREARTLVRFLLWDRRLDPNAISSHNLMSSIYISEKEKYEKIQSASS